MGLAVLQCVQVGLTHFTVRYARLPMVNRGVQYRQHERALQSFQVNPQSDKGRQHGIDWTQTRFDWLAHSALTVYNSLSIAADQFAHAQRVFDKSILRVLV